MILTESEEKTILSRVPACPSWCTEKPTHGADQVALGTQGRIHYAPAPYDGATLSVNDDPTDELPWYLDIAGELELHAESADDLKAQIAGVIDNLSATVAWIGANA